DLSIKMTIIVAKLFKVFCWGFDFLKNQSPNKTYTTKGRVPFKLLGFNTESIRGVLYKTTSSEL
ncbi:hypothetical protein VB776_21950, partial [Arcicella sp. DC2W]